MNKIKKRSFGAGVGGIMVFTVISVLCIAVFAVLSMSSALADLRLSEKTAQMAKEYYELDAIGVRILCRAEQMWEQDSAAPNEEALVEQLRQIAPEAEFWVYQDEGLINLSVSIPVGENRTFEIAALLSAQPHAETGSRWSIERWSLGAAGFGEEELDLGMPIWVGK